MQPTLSKQKFNYSLLYLLGLEDQFNAKEDAFVHLDRLDLCNMIAPILGGEYL